MSAPDFIYGTAWKEAETERLTRMAIDSGFRAIDTANQRRHYFEAGVGAAVAGAIRDGIVRREDLFLQTKFTYAPGQDHRLPYDPAADPATQVQQSFASSLEHLQIEIIDSYVLHGPSQRRGLGKIDVEVWRAMERLHSSGRARSLGISNVEPDQLEQLWELAAVKPAFVQNRCFAVTGWDAKIRAFCAEKGIAYQGFSLLTANTNELRHPWFQQLVRQLKKTPAQIIFRFAKQVGMIPLTGTTNESHMREDLAIDDFALSDEDIKKLLALS